MDVLFVIMRERIGLVEKKCKVRAKLFFFCHLFINLLGMQYQCSWILFFKAILFCFYFEFYFCNLSTFTFFLFSLPASKQSLFLLISESERFPQLCNIIATYIYTNKLKEEQNMHYYCCYFLGVKHAFLLCVI